MKILQPNLFAIAAALSTSPQVRAAAIIFDDTSPDETIAVFGNSFQGGLFLNGALFQIGFGVPATTTLPETADPITFSGTFDAPGTPPSTGSRTIYLVESDGTTLSDILHVSWVYTGTSGTITGSFVSDVGDLLGTLPPGVSPDDVFVEDGTPVGIGRDFFNVEVRSDAPDSGSFLLLPFSLVLLGCMKWYTQPKALRKAD